MLPSPLHLAVVDFPVRAWSPPALAIDTTKAAVTEGIVPCAASVASVLLLAEATLTDVPETNTRAERPLQADRVQPSASAAGGEGDADGRTVWRRQQ